MMPEGVGKIIRQLKNAGFPAYAVGGCVRDALLDRVPHDWDVTTAAPAQKVQSLFARTVPTGEKYGTVTVLMDGERVEVTTFRRDGVYRDARKPESVEFVSDLREDLSRRDFTVNAMAMSDAGAITDLFNGREDLKRRLIRCVGDPEKRFSEDALRMLRAVRFSAQLGFEIEPATLSALRRLAPLCRKLSAERVLAELEKTLSSPSPEKVGELIEYGLLEKSISKNAKNLPYDRLPPVPERLRLTALALMASQAGYSADPAELLRTLRAPARDVKLAREAQIIFPETPDERQILTALTEHDPDAVLVSAAARGVYRQARETKEKRKYVRPAELTVTGDDLSALGLRGSEIGATLRRLALLVTLEGVPNQRETLLESLRNR